MEDPYDNRDADKDDIASHDWSDGAGRPPGLVVLAVGILLFSPAAGLTRRRRRPLRRTMRQVSTLAPSTPKEKRPAGQRLKVW